MRKFFSTANDPWSEEFEFINWLNKPGFLPDDKEEYLRDLAKKTYLDSSGNEHPYITDEELVSLSIKKGSLNDDERSKIQKHIIHTKTLLNKLPNGLETSLRASCAPFLSNLFIATKSAKSSISIFSS